VTARPTRHVLTLDQGTSALKAALWTEGGRVVAEATAGYQLERPAPDWAEIDPERWWAALTDASRAVLAKGGVTAEAIAAIALDGIGWTLVPVDRALQPLVPAMTWLDRRAEAEAAGLRARADAAALVDLVANPLDAAYITPKLAWLRAHRPDSFAATRWFLTASGYLVARLTGEATCDLTQAYGFHCFDIRRERWDAEIASSLGIPADRLPSLRRAGHHAGGLAQIAARETGLAPGIPVLVGGLDAAMGALGSGVTRPGLTQDQGGSAGGFGMSVAEVVVEPRLIFSHHVLEGQYLLQAGTVGGGALGWLREVVGGGDLPYEALTGDAAASPPGANGVLFLPYLAGERTPLWSSTPRGVFAGLTYATRRGDLVRAVLEGCAFAVLDNLRLAEAGGHRVEAWLGQGGAARSATWNQVKADVTGVPFTVARLADGTEGGAGLALFALAARAAGLAGDPASTVEQLLVRRTTFEPDPARHARYRELFQVWHEVSRAMLPQFERMANVRPMVEVT
jgi:sugar (pentulose or hexulose) kinase